MSSTSSTALNPDEPAAYRISAFCEKVGGLSRSKFYELAKTGQIRVLKSGRRSIVPATEVPRYLGSLRPLHAV